MSELRFVESKTIPYGKFAGRRITEDGDVFAKGGKGLFYTKVANASGLLKITIQPETEYIHLLVARTFIPIKVELPYVLHKDGNIGNNHKDNLVWSKYPDLDHADFKTIPGYSKYKISKKGVIKSYTKRHVPKIISPKKTLEGYKEGSLKNDDGGRSSIKVARLVALTYLPNPENLPTVDHIDRDRSNDCLENLRWASHSTQSNNRDLTTRFKKPVCRYDKTGEFIDEYESVSAAVLQLANLKLSASTIGANAVKNKDGLKFVTKKGFMWRFKTYDDVYVLEEGEEMIQIVGTFDDLVVNFPAYSITNFGNVINDRGYKIASSSKVSYPYYKLRNNGEKGGFSAHVLVALFFVEGRTLLKNEVDHLDENRENPRFDNLEWVTHQENIRRMAQKFCKPVNKLDITTGKVLETFKSTKEASAKTGISRSGISNALCKNKKTAGGFGWEFVA